MSSTKKMIRVLRSTISLPSFCVKATDIEKVWRLRSRRKREKKREREREKKKKKRKTRRRFISDDDGDDDVRGGLEGSC